MSANDLDVIKQIVDLIGHLAWPITVMIVIFSFKDQIARFLNVLTERAKDPQSDISVGRDGVTITRQKADADGREREIILLTEALERNENGFEGRLTGWVKGQDKDLSVALFLNQEKYAELRKKAVTDLGLS